MNNGRVIQSAAVYALALKAGLSCPASLGGSRVNGSVPNDGSGLPGHRRVRQAARGGPQGRSSSSRAEIPRPAADTTGPIPEPLGRATMKDGTLTTQTFSGDEAQAPATPTGSVTSLPGPEDETHAVPFRDFGISEAICSGLEAAGIFTTFP